MYVTMAHSSSLLEQPEKLKGFLGGGQKLIPDSCVSPVSQGAALQEAAAIRNWGRKQIIG